MKYRIKRENIEFLAEEDEVSAIVRAIVESLVPKKADKLYFYSGNTKLRESVAKMDVPGLITMTEDNADTFQRYQRIHYHNGCVTLVPIVDGKLKQNEWIEACKNVSTLLNRYA